MSATIRCALCAGRKRNRVLSIVVTDKRKRRDSGFIKKIGTINPYLEANHKNKIYISDSDAFISHIKNHGELSISERVRREIKRNEHYAQLFKGYFGIAK